MVLRFVKKRFPCAVASCPAMVEKAGRRCGVHQTWTPGPSQYVCVKCRQPIVFGDLYRLVAGDPTTPGHQQCLGKRRTDRRKPNLVQDNLFQEPTT